ncbi:uncharacterized protein LOC123519779 [Portunus trituberculatus]|uniref:uncharacterized protein LOC123519779 n=1 Tax=Portunus trituberculatus TaxID=210409 RepID=UPI001E1CE349|nr:uncharacterized protein LOC123519779 [Portunus trituberculatus]
MSSQNSAEEAPIQLRKRRFFLLKARARLQQFSHCWSRAPHATLKMLQRGFHWKWLKEPPPLHIPKLNSPALPDLDLEIQALLLKGAAYEVPPQPCFISRIFLVPKSTGGNRLILDLSSLNSHIIAPYFHMHNHRSLAATLQPPAWMASIDLQDAYLHVPIRQCLHKYLAFSFGTKLYFFKTLPFGLNVAPHIFTRILRWPLSLLHLQGINIHAYLDDWVIWDKTYELTAKAVNTTINLLRDLGFLINIPKSHLLPSTDLEWLGVRWLPLLGRWALPKNKQVAILTAIKHILSQNQVSRRQWEHLLGKLTFATQILRHNQPLLQPLLRPQMLSDHLHRDTLKPLTSDLAKHLQPWLLPETLASSHLFHHSGDTIHLWTDASLFRMGRSHSCSSGIRYLGYKRVITTHQLSRSSSSPSLNFVPQLNRLPTPSIHRQSGSTMCHKQVKMQVNFAVKRDLKSQQIPLFMQTPHQSFRDLYSFKLKGRQPEPTSDHLNRMVSPRTNIQVHSDMERASRIDLMAMNKNKKLPLYISPYPDPEALTSNALAQDWNRWEQIYIFPPK